MEIDPLTSEEAVYLPVSSPVHEQVYLVSSITDGVVTVVSTPPSPMISVYFDNYGDTESTQAAITPQNSMKEIFSGRVTEEERQFQKAAQTHKIAKNVDGTDVVKILKTAAGEEIEVVKLDVGGKVKEIYIRRLPEEGTVQKAYLIAQGEIGGSQERELMEEQVKSDTIDARARKNRTKEEAEEDGEELFLNLQMKPAEGSIEGKHTAVQALALGNLDSVIRERRFTPAQTLAICIQVAKAFRNLHRAGYTHGDAKLENMLVYITEKGDVIVRLADFGKAGEPGYLYLGNTRFMSVEGGNTFEGEVYSAALIMIRVLEAPFLDRKGDMLLEIEESELKKAEIGKVRPEKKERTGIEKHLSLHKDARQRDVEGASGLTKVSVYAKQGRARILRLYRPKAEGSEEAVIHAYIDKLTEVLIQGKRYSPAQAYPLRALLRQMTLSAPNARPKMNEVVDQLKEIEQVKV
jgi:Protein kinase domain